MGRFASSGQIRDAPPESAPVLVCHCKAKTDGQIRDVVLAGSHTCSEVGRVCGAGTDCKGCLPTIMAILSEQKLSPARAPRSRLSWRSSARLVAERC